MFEGFSDSVVSLLGVKRLPHLALRVVELDEDGNKPPAEQQWQNVAPTYSNRVVVYLQMK